MMGEITGKWCITLFFVRQSTSCCTPGTPMLLPRRLSVIRVCSHMGHDEEREKEDL